MAKSVFISSTSLDLKLHRSAVNAVIRRLKLRPIDMEDFGSQPGGASGVSIKEVQSAHIFIGIIAHRYGYVPDGITKSVTEQEYDEAVRRGIPRLMYLVQPDYDWDWAGKTAKREDDLAKQQLEDFKAKINRDEVRSLFTTPDNLAKQVSTDLSKYLTQTNPGRVRLPVWVVVIGIVTASLVLFFRTTTGHLLIDRIFLADTMAFAEDEIGVVLADFGDESVELGLENGFTKANVKYIRVHYPLNDRSEARQLSELYNATIVIYGQSMNGAARGVNLQFEIVPRPQQYIETTIGNLLVTADLEFFNTIILEGTDALYVVNLVEGQIAYFKHDYAIAIEFFNLAEKYTPKGRETAAKVDALYFYRGNTYFRQRQYENAIADLTKAIALNPQNIEAYNTRAGSYFNQSRYTEAIIDFSKSIDLKSDDAMTYSNRGLAYFALGQQDSAIADYSKAITLNPNLFVVYSNRGGFYWMQGQYENAVADFTKAIALEPDYVTAHTNRGTLYWMQGQYENAIVDFTRVISLEPDNALAYRDRGYIYFLQGQHDNALADLTKAIIFKPDDGNIYNYRGKIYFIRQQYDDAIMDFNKAIELQRDYTEAYYWRGAAYLYQEQYDDAIMDLNKVIDLQPDYVDAYYYRASIYYTQQQYDNAITDLNKVIDLQPNYVNAYANRGNAYNLNGSFEAAIADYRTYEQITGHLEPFMEEQIAAMEAKISETSP